MTQESPGMSLPEKVGFLVLNPLHLDVKIKISLEDSEDKPNK